MKTFLLSDVDSPQVVFEVGDQQIESTIIKNTKKTPNFDKPLLFLDVVSFNILSKEIPFMFALFNQMLPKEDFYAPAMNIKVKDYRSFGRKPVVGFHIIKSLEIFRCNPTIPSLTLIQPMSKSFSSSFTYLEISLFRTCTITTHSFCG
jgi:dysferlin